MDDLEKNYSRFDENLKDLYRKQKEDLDNVLQHVYELRKRTESRETAAPIRNLDTQVGKKDLQNPKNGF
jgi:polyhydroxyalkanoate synthesis regulator phasin